MTHLAIGSGFASSDNVLEFRVNNTGSTGPIDPTGLDVSFNGTAKPVPEPASCALVALLLPLVARSKKIKH